MKKSFQRNVPHFLKEIAAKKGMLLLLFIFLVLFIIAFVFSLQKDREEQRTSNAANLISNGSFETTGASWLSPWVLQITNGAAATASQSGSTQTDGSYSSLVNITQVVNPWDIQLKQPVSLSSGQTYTITFSAKASSSRTITALLQEVASPYTVYSTQDFSVGTSWQSYTFSYTATATDADARFILNLAQATGQVWIDNVSVGTAPTPTPNGSFPPAIDSSWQLIFSDDFDGTSLDTTKWIPCIGNGKVVGTGQCQGWGSELQTYKPENVSVSNGILRLTALNASGTYTSGSISTANDIFGFNQQNYDDFTYQYGYLETRVKVPGSQGIWPAVWQLPYNGSGAEIDLVEILGSDVSKAYLTLHKDGGAQEQGIVTGTNFSTDYHVFGVKWEPTKISWYVDGVKKFETTGGGIPTQAMYLMANLAVGGDWPGAPNGTTIFPAVMEVDYIKVWQQSTVTPTPTPTSTPAQTPTPTPLPATATINASPVSGTLIINSPTTVTVTVNGGGQAFNAAQATVATSSNLTVTNLTNGNCNFTYTQTPTAADPSFAGAVLGSSSNSCTVYTLTVQPNAGGTGTISFSAGSVKAFANTAEILSGVQNGSYTLAAPTSTPTPVLTATPTPTVTPTPTATPTPLPTATPTPATAPSVTTVQTNTYNNILALSGTKTAAITAVYINGTANGVSYPTSTTWQSSMNLAYGNNVVSIYGKNASNQQTATNTITINRHKLADINGDDAIDLTDVSLFGADWQKTNNFISEFSDMNGDAIINLTDFSILAKQYGQ